MSDARTLAAADAEERAAEWRAYFGPWKSVGDSPLVMRHGHDRYGPRGFAFNIAQRAGATVWASLRNAPPPPGVEWTH